MEKTCKSCNKSAEKFIGRLCYACNSKRALEYYRSHFKKDQCQSCKQTRIISIKTSLCKTCQIISEYQDQGA